MTQPPLPRLRHNLDVMPSPLADRPGLLIRDPYRYSDVTAVLPPLLADCLRFFDGTRTELELKQRLFELTASPHVGEVSRQLVETLRGAGFLDDERYRVLRETRHREFAAQALRPPVHAGAAYPGEAGALRELLDRCLTEAEPDTEAANLIGIAAPHISPDGGLPVYGAAYRRLGPDLRDRTFVILGTSHYGEPDRFGLTRKPFLSPLGETPTNVDLVDRLAAEAREAVAMEDYCHAIEHSIEFQVVFLQHIFGPDIRILPILCGSFGRGLSRAEPPEGDDRVARFLGTLGEMAAREGQRLFWVLAIDMAHMGRRYGDALPARAGRGEMRQVSERDRQRIDRLLASDPAGFWDLVRENGDDLKWCGSSPAYTFLRAVPDLTGNLLRYEQWNIDDQSVVSFAALSFSRAASSSGVVTGAEQT